MGSREVTDSLFAVCRCAVALTYADGVLSDEERVVLKEYFINLNLSDNQIKILESDFNNPNPDFGSLYSKITEKKDRAFLINIARVMFYRDGDYSYQEQKMMDVMMKSHMKTVDIDSAKDEIKELSNAEIKGLEEGSKSIIADRVISYMEKIFG